MHIRNNKQKKVHNELHLLTFLRFHYLIGFLSNDSKLQNNIE